MKTNFFLSVLVLILCGCEGMDYERESDFASNEPSWSSFAKENNMDWSEHYWSDREVKGNQGYLSQKSYKPSKSKTISTSAAPLKQEVADERPADSVDTAVSQRIYPETTNEIPAPVIVQSSEKPPVSLDSKNLDLEREETMEVGPSEVKHTQTVVKSSIQKQELQSEHLTISQSKPEKIKTDLRQPVKKMTNVLPVKPKEKTPVIQKKVQMPQTENLKSKPEKIKTDLPPKSLPPVNKVTNIVPVKSQEKTPVIQKTVQAPQKSKSIESKSTQYVVKKGENLWKIAGLKEVYGDSTKWEKIYQANRGKMKSPNHVYPGQVLVIPRE